MLSRIDDLVQARNYQKAADVAVFLDEDPDAIDGVWSDVPEAVRVYYYIACGRIYCELDNYARSLRYLGKAGLRIWFGAPLEWRIEIPFRTGVALSLAKKSAEALDIVDAFIRDDLSPVERDAALRLRVLRDSLRHECGR